MEKEEIQTRLEFYGDIYERALERVSTSDAACVIVQEIGKDSRQARINAGSDENLSGVKRVINGDEPATDKQRDFLKRLKVKDVPADLNRADASEMIDEALEKESE